jgi:hypothetical protein
MWKRLSLVCGCLLYLGGPILALSANDLRNKLVEIPQPSLVAASPYRVDGLALGDQVRFGQQAYQRYQCGPSDEFPGFISCNEEHTTSGNEVARSHSILQAQDGTAYYVNSYFDPAFFDPNDIQSEINRMSSEFGREARIIQMPQREGLPNAVMATWGAIQLEPLSSDEISVVASGGGHPDILVSFLGDLERSAKAGVPVYRWLAAQDFCGWQPSIRTEEGCYGIWRLTIQRLNPLVKLHQTRKIKPTRTQALLTHPYLHSQAYNSNHNQMLKPGKEDQYLAADMSGQCTLVKRCRTLSRLRRVIIPTAEQVRVDT